MSNQTVSATYAPVTMRPFAKEDWYGFCDAQRFADGSEPLIGELHVVGCRGAEKAIVLLDSDGLHVLAYNDDTGEECGMVDFDGPFASRAMAMLRNGMSWQVLRAMSGAEVMG